MVLLSIIVRTPEKLRKVPKTKYWILQEPYSADFVTDIGTFKLRLKAGWITDYRSGSSLIDCIVPKKGNKLFNCSVLCHDCAYSGHIPKDEADELLRQGMILSGLAEWRANMAYTAVQAFGGSAYYDLETPLKTPYTDNREKEYLELEAK